MAKIGIPRSLAYFLYFPFWKTFFEKLGHQVVVSAPTTRSILDRGVEEAVNDACIPIKIYHGHVDDLLHQADYIFCPRLVSVRRHGDFGTETFCPKFLGLPDLIKYTFADAPPIIDTRIDLKQGKNQLQAVCVEIGSLLNHPAEASRAACQQARYIQRQFQALLEQEKTPLEAMAILFEEQSPRLPALQNPDLRIAVVGYPYALYDPYINVGLLNILAKENVLVYTQDMLNDKILNREARELPKSMFWYFSNRVVYGALHYMKKPNIDGIIHVTAFACGPDSMVDRLLEIEAKRRQSKPYLSIAIDEHTGEAGVRTRVEAFLDMLRYRRDKQ